MRLLRVVAVVVALAGVVLMAPGVSTAESSGGSVATLGTGTVDLSSGWGAAKACFSAQQGAELECFASVAAMKAAEAKLGLTGSSSPAGSSSAAPATSCSSYVELFSGASYTGLEFDDFDDGYWLNLSSVGFADLTVSFAGGACQFYLAQGTNGGGSWYPGYTGPYGTSTNMGLYWNDTIKSVYIV
jgi:hypothetical protein